MKKVKLLSVLLTFLLLFTSCIEIVPPQAETEESSSEVETSAVPEEPTSEPDTPKKEWVPPITFPEATPLPARQFDKDEIYRHVFEDQSVEIPQADYQSIEVDTTKGEALVWYALNFVNDVGFEFNKGYYVKHFETETVYETSMKYQTTLFYWTPGVIQRKGYVRNDYHEAYLDVMFEQLTFTACEGMPGYKEQVYLIGMIYADHGSYYVCSEGYLYRYERVDGKDVYAKSDQKIDAPYLSCMLLLPYFYEMDREEYDHYQTRTYFNFDVSTIQNPTRVEREGDATNYYMKDGSVIKVIDPRWMYIEHHYGFPFGAISFYVARTIHFSTVSMLEY